MQPPSAPESGADIPDDGDPADRMPWRPARIGTGGCALAALIYAAAFAAALIVQFDPRTTLPERLVVWAVALAFLLIMIGTLRFRERERRDSCLVVDRAAGVLRIRSSAMTLAADIPLARIAAVALLRDGGPWRVVVRRPGEPDVMVSGLLPESEAEAHALRLAALITRPLERQAGAEGTGPVAAAWSARPLDAQDAPAQAVASMLTRAGRSAGPGAALPPPPQAALSAPRDMTPQLPATQPAASDAPAVLHAVEVQPAMDMRPLLVWGPPVTGAVVLALAAIGHAGAVPLLLIGLVTLGVIAAVRVRLPAGPAILWPARTVGIDRAGRRLRVQGGPEGSAPPGWIPFDAILHVLTTRSSDGPRVGVSLALCDRPPVPLTEKPNAEEAEALAAELAGLLGCAVVSR